MNQKVNAVRIAMATHWANLVVGEALDTLSRVYEIERGSEDGLPEPDAKLRSRLIAEINARWGLVH